MYRVFWILETGEEKESSDVWSEAELRMLKVKFQQKQYPAYTKNNNLFIATWTPDFLPRHEVIMIENFVSKKI